MQGKEDYYGSQGDITTNSFHFIRDGIFQGNETAYAVYGIVSQFVSLFTMANTATGSLGKSALSSTISIATQKGLDHTKLPEPLKFGASIAVDLLVSHKLMGKTAGTKVSEGGSYSGLTQSQIENIVNTPKGSRPNPTTYLSQEYVETHLAQFDDGVSVIQTEWAYSRYSEINGFVGVPDDNSLFVMPKKYCDDVISRANGNISIIIEKELGFPEGYFSDGGGLIRIDAPNTSKLNIHIPSGNETGANKLWIPEGKLLAEFQRR